MGRLWDKGGADPLDARILRYTAGEDHVLDARLVPYDVRASIAHGRMLMESGYLSPADFERIAAALDDLARSHAAGEWQIALEEEDVHTALENRLVVKIGAAGERLHLGRSRNDQVLAALRLYMKDAAAQLAARGEECAAALDALARAQGDVPLPGYTHMQRAMPSTVALWASGFAAEIRDDVAALARATIRADKNPLGSAAGYGTPGLALNRARTAELLGFATVHEPVTAVQLSRGKAEASLLFETTLLMQDLGRLASDLCLFATSEYGFIHLPERFTTGSSIMPQKRNPDLFELVRARAAGCTADLIAALAIPAKLPSGYHRDLQLLKAPLFRAIDTAAATLDLLAHALPDIRFDAGRTAAAIDPSLHAAERAYRLSVERGIPFREAYREVAKELAGKPKRRE